MFFTLLMILKNVHIFGKQTFPPQRSHKSERQNPFIWYDQNSNIIAS